MAGLDTVAISLWPQPIEEIDSGSIFLKSAVAVVCRLGKCRTLARFQIADDT